MSLQIVTKKFTVYLPDELHKKLKIYAIKKEKPATELVKNLIEKELKKSK